MRFLSPYYEETQLFSATMRSDKAPCALKPAVLIPGPAFNNKPKLKIGHPSFPVKQETSFMFALRTKQSAHFFFRQVFKNIREKQTHYSNRMASRYVKDNHFVYIAFPEAPVYLKQGRLSHQGETESRIWGGLEKYSSGRSIYFAFPKGDHPSGVLGCYIWSAIQSQKLFRKAASFSGINVAHCLSFSKNGLENFQENETNNDFCRGVCLYQEKGSEIKDIDIESFLKEQDFDFASVSESSHKLWTWKNIPDNDAEELVVVCTEPHEVSNKLKQSCVSPIFTQPYISPVFRSFGEARNVLEKNLDFPEVVELLEITDKHVPQKLEIDSPETSCKHPFVVVEGMDATGKTTLTQILEDKLGAARYYTPPPQVQHLRPFFDRLPEIVRRAYYCMGNYIVAQDIIKECESRPVIMDRFWYSTTAYAIANETSSGDMPKAGHSVYRWAKELLKPRLVLFLTVSEEVRKQRLSGRGLGSTFEEKSLDKDQLFRQRLCDSYLRMAEPSCIEIDASGTVEEVSALAQKALENHGIQLKLNMEHSAE